MRRDSLSLCCLGSAESSSSVSYWKGTIFSALSAVKSAVKVVVSLSQARGGEENTGFLSKKGELPAVFFLFLPAEVSSPFTLFRKSKC